MAYIIDDAYNIKALSNEKSVIQFNVLVVNFNVTFAFFFDVIKRYKPRKIIINADITNFSTELFIMLPKDVLADLVTF